MRVIFGLSLITASILCQAFPKDAEAKNDPVQSENTCLNGVVNKYNIQRDAVKVVYRGDDSFGDHIVNYTIKKEGQLNIEGICLVKIADSTVRIKELEDYPSEKSQ